jgi:hypothetical protein
MRGHCLIDPEDRVHKYGHHKCVVRVFMHPSGKGRIGYRGVARVVDHWGNVVNVLEMILTGENEDEICPHDVFDALLLEVATEYGRPGDDVSI